MAKEKIVIGRSDIIDLPEFGVSNIKAKIDSGAYTSSIHCSKPKLSIVEGKKRISFYILDNLHEQINNKEFYSEEYSERNIKNSFGQIERRFIIKTKITIFNKIIRTEFSLSDRKNMKHPVLLGRKFLKGRFIVDVSKFNLSYKLKRKKAKKKLPDNLTQKNINP
ncbi:MAG TPA: RimK/LysX family protein [Cytophagaceae bacterium]|jgi:hypothetical protein